MNYEVNGAHDESSQDKCRNRLNSNTSMNEVKLREMRKIRGEPEDKCVHDDEPESESEDNNGAKDEGEDGLEDKVEDSECETEEDETEDGGGEDESRNPAIREPERECVAGGNEDKFRKPVHELHYTMPTGSNRILFRIFPYIKNRSDAECATERNGDTSSAHRVGGGLSIRPFLERFSIVEALENLGSDEMR